MSALVLVSGDLLLFGVLEHSLLGALLLGFYWFDRVLVAEALQREASPKTCRSNNFGPPYL